MKTLARRFCDISVGDKFFFAPDIDLSREHPSAYKQLSCRYTKSTAEESVRGDGKRIRLRADDIVAVQAAEER